MKKFAIALALMLTPAFAFAGGGNSKEDPTLQVCNNGSLTALVVIDEFTEEMEDALEENDFNDAVAQFESGGGIVLSPGECSVEMDVKVGYHTVYYYYTEGINDRPSDPDDFENIRVFVSRGEAEVVRIGGSSSF